uniref:Putative ovule protein n=1 Tax=Solanum chacoense TaxID=4108 RepID=A0A0V0H0X8_SOLCH
MMTLLDQRDLSSKALLVSKDLLLLRSTHSAVQRCFVIFSPGCLLLLLFIQGATFVTVPGLDPSLPADATTTIPFLTAWNEPMASPSFK